MAEADPERTGGSGRASQYPKTLGLGLPRWGSNPSSATSSAAPHLLPHGLDELRVYHILIAGIAQLRLLLLGWGQDWPVEYVRKASALERLNRAFRQKARQGGTLQAEAGRTAAVGLVRFHRECATPAPPADLWTAGLEAGLLAA